MFFRLLLALPHLVWLLLWTAAALPVAFVGWVLALFEGRLADPIHRFLAAYTRYTVHVQAFLFLVANPFPGFVGRPGSYPVDVEFDPRELQNRWTIGFRWILAFPTWMLSGALGGGAGGGGGSGGQGGGFSAGTLATAGFLGWWASLFTGRMPRGLRDLGAYSIAYGAQTTGYSLLVTGRYPNSDPEVTVAAAHRPPHPVRVRDGGELRRSRLTVFFRLLLALPHLAWLTLWSIAAVLAVIAAWFATLVRGRNADALHRFLVRFVRYALHVYAFLWLTANPFPGFTGGPGSYPVELDVDPPQAQNRWKTGFRAILAVPAIAVNGATGAALLVAALLGWWAALFTARMPGGLRNLQVYALRYQAQLHAYLFLLTDAYPYSGPHVRPPEAAPPGPPFAG